MIYLPQILQALQHLFSWVGEQHGWGLLLFIGVVITGCILLVPLTFFGIGAGLTFPSIYGSGPGFGISLGSVFIGYYLGSLLAFLLGRYLCRSCARKCLVQRLAMLEALDLALGREGTKLVTLLRLAVCSPYNLLNYALAITQVSFGAYALGSLSMIVHVLLDIIGAYTLHDLSALLHGNFKDSAFLLFIVAL